MAAEVLLDSSFEQIGSATVAARPTRWHVFSDATVSNTVKSLPPSSMRVVVHLGIHTGRQIVVGLQMPGLQMTDTTTRRLTRSLTILNRILTAEPSDDFEPTDASIVAKALELLVPLIPHADADPQFFPLADGGLLARWKSDDGSLHIEFDADGDVVVLVVDKTGKQRSGYLWELWGAATRWLFKA